MFKYLDKKFDEWHETYFKEEKEKKLFSVLVFAGFSSLMFNDLNQWIIFNSVFNVLFLTINKTERENYQVEKKLNKKEIDFNELENDNNKKEKAPKEIKNELMLGNLFKK